MNISKSIGLQGLLGIGLSLLLFACSENGDPPKPEDRFLGTYRMTEQCSGDRDSYTLSIARSGNRLEVTNLFNVGERSAAYVNSRDELVISSTYFGDQGNCKLYIEDARGTLSGSTLSIVFDIGTGSTLQLGCNSFSTSCIAEGSK